MIIKNSIKLDRIMIYEQWVEILTSAFAERDLNEDNIIERIKEKLKMADLHTYQAWEKENFNVNHYFDVTTCKNGNFTGTLLSAVAANTYISIYDALVKKGALVNASNININARFDYSQCQLEFAKTLTGAINEISQNTNIIKPKTKQYTLLYIAIKENRLDIVTYLVGEIKADITMLGTTSKTAHALDSAICRNHQDIVKYLIETKKVDFNNCNCVGLSAVHYAASCGHLDVVKYLIDEKKANFTTIGHTGNSPLDYAAREGHLEVVKYLVDEKNVNCNVANGEDGTTLQKAIIHDGDIELIKYLVNKGANIHTKNNEDMTLVLSAALSGKLNVLKYIIEEKHGNIYDRDKIGRTILHCAVASDNLDMVKYLIEKKGLQQYINIRRSDNNWTTLYEAVCKGYYEITEFLISQGATLTSCDKDMNTPLHIAVEKGHDTIVELLLVRSNAELNMRNKSGYTPLHFAVKEGHIKIVNCLMEKGANVNMEDDKGNTPLDLTMYSLIKKMVAACYSTVN